MDPLSSETTRYLRLKSELMQEIPDIDDETLEDTLEGVTDLKEMLLRIVRSQLEDSAFCDALRARISEMKCRLERLDARCSRKRQLVTEVMDKASRFDRSRAQFSSSTTARSPNHFGALSRRSSIARRCSLPSRMTKSSRAPCWETAVSL
jgi:hypothetical protein